MLHELSTDYYATVPAHSHDRAWRPSLEAAAYGIAAADYGAQGAILMGLSAARLHGAIPRALAVAVVAIDRNRPNLTLADRDATVLFVRRDTGRLDAEQVSTDLGAALATTIEQSLLDLAHRPDLGGVTSDAQEAVQALWPRADPDQLEHKGRPGPSTVCGRSGRGVAISTCTLGPKRHRAPVCRPHPPPATPGHVPGMVVRAYEVRCAVCRLRHGDLLDAAHITADSEEIGLAVVTSGLSLCKIHHAAYDRQLLGITPKYKVEINRSLLDEVDGPMLKYGLQEMHGTTIKLPRRKTEHPDPDRLGPSCVGWAVSRWTSASPRSPGTETICPRQMSETS